MKDYRTSVFFNISRIFLYLLFLPNTDSLISKNDVISYYIAEPSQNQRFLFPFLLEASPTGADVPTGEQKRIKTEQDPAAESAALFKQELLRSLSCWNRSDAEQPLPELLLDHPGQTEQQQNSAIQNISDHSLLESLNSWWGSSL
jgi:hypothetical protein